jgi:hypothetical protein
MNSVWTVASERKMPAIDQRFNRRIGPCPPLIGVWAALTCGSIVQGEQTAIVSASEVVSEKP